MAWLSDWAKRIEITVDNTNVDSDLTHFPVPIVLGTSVGQSSQDTTAVFTELGANSKKIAVTKDDGTTQLYVEIETWDESAQEALLWVSKSGWTITSASDTELYLYFDGTATDNATYIGDTGERAAQEVWASDKVVINNLNESSGDIIDSSGNAYHGAMNGSTYIRAVDGRIGLALDLNDGDYITYPDISGDFTDEATLELVLKLDNSTPSDSNDCGFCEIGSDSSYYPYTTGEIYCGVFLEARYGPISNSFDRSQWHLLTIKNKPGTDGYKILQNDLEIYSGDGKASVYINGSSVKVGNNKDDYLLGEIESIRIWNSFKSASWTKANSYALTDNLLTFGAEEIFSVGWLSDWAKRIEITIDNTNVDSDLTHFPVPIVLGASVGQDNQNLTDIFTELGANSKKIAVTKDDGTTQLYVEIEIWDDASESAVLWVSKSDLTISSSETTTLYLYYDSTQADNTTYIGDTGDAAAQNVWDSFFLAVYHMAQDPNGGVAGAIKDSTSNGNHGTPNGSMTSADLVDGDLGKAIDFDGSDDWIDTPQIIGRSDTFTLQVLGRYEGTSSKPVMFSFKDVGDMRLRLNSGSIEWAIYNQNYVGSVDSFYDDGRRINTVIVRDKSSGQYLYIDGALNNSNAETDDANSESSNSGIAYNHGGDYYWQGPIEEVRLLNDVLSSSWIKADNNALTDNLLTFGAEESPPGSEVTAYKIYGTVKINSVAANRPVRIYKRDNGIFVAKSTPVSGEYTVANQEDGTQISGTLISGEYLISGEMYYATCIDNQGSYEAQTIDRILPTRYLYTLS